MVVVDEVAVVVPDCDASNSTVSVRAVALELFLLWSTVQMILQCILYWYLRKVHYLQQMQSKDRLHHCDLALQFLARMKVDDVCQGWMRCILLCTVP